MVLSVLALALSSVPAVAKSYKPKQPVGVQILAINEFHGNLQPPTGSSGRIGPSGTPEYGGAAFLATHLHNLEATNRRNTVIVSAGDLIGASPLLSALFHDEPTIEAANLWGLDFNAVGNHEFDRARRAETHGEGGVCHPVCERVDPTTIMLNGVVVDPAASYRVTVNSLLADGGDSFPILIAGTDRLGGAVDTDALEAYFVAHVPVLPGPQNRITVVP